jgi:hypothetical protein
MQGNGGLSCLFYSLILKKQKKKQKKKTKKKNKKCNLICMSLWYWLIIIPKTSCLDAVSKIYQGFATGDLNLTFSQLDASIEWTTAGSVNTLTTRTYQGLAGAKAYFDDDALVFTTKTFTPEPEAAWMVMDNQVGVGGTECGVYTFNSQMSYCNIFFHRWYCGSNGLVNKFIQYQVTHGK